MTPPPQTDRIPTMKHYFAQDGNYGTADEIEIVDTSNWTEEMWDLIDEYEYARHTIAFMFNAGQSVKQTEDFING